MKKTICIITFVFLAILSKAQNIEWKKYIKENTSLDKHDLNDRTEAYLACYPPPALSKQQMFDDFDTWISIIERNDSQLEARKWVTGFDNLEFLKQQRKFIDTLNTTLEFAYFIGSNICLLHDLHATSTISWFSDYSLDALGNKISDKTRGCSLHYQRYFRKIIKQQKSIYLNYLNGSYYIRFPFYTIVNNDSILVDAGTKLLSINNQNASIFLNNKALFSQDARWDVKQKTFYTDSNCDSHDWKEIKVNGVNGNINVDSITFVYPKYHRRSMEEINPVYYFPSDSILYVCLAEMDLLYAKYLKSEIKRYSKHPLKKVIFDIRNNPGGNDKTWQDLLCMVISSPIEFDIKQAINSKSDALSLFSKNRIKKFKKTRLPYLNNQEVLILDDGHEVYKPKSGSLNFDGEIIILQNENSYSSATAFSSMANLTSRITSMGTNTGRVLGRGITPIKFVLPNSLFLFQLEPCIDITNATSALDVYQDDVDVQLDLPIDYYIYCANHPEEVYTKEYLLNEDAFFEQVLEYIRKQ